MPHPEFQQAENDILNRLENELNPTLYYHGFHHTKDVMDAAMNIARTENIGDTDLNLLRIAAAYHDAGFIYVYKDHEEKGCEMAEENLPKLGFSKEQIGLICGMIMATKIPQTPKNKLEEILADADLDYLGRDDVYPIAQSLFEELKIHAGLTDEKNWNEIQIRFLQSHRFFTTFSKKHRKPGKEKYLAELIAGN